MTYTLPRPLGSVGKVKAWVKNALPGWNLYAVSEVNHDQDTKDDLKGPCPE